MDSSGSASAYKLQLAFAALVGASGAAAAAYYLHCRAVAQVSGDLARSASRRRRPRAPAGAAGGKTPPPRRAAAGSASLPDLSAFYDGGGAGGYLVEEEEEEEGLVGPRANGALDAAAFLPIPQGLPRLHVGPDGNKQLVRSGSNRRVGIIRPNSPKSPIAGASAFKSADGSDEDDATQNGSKLDNGYLNTNGNLVQVHPNTRAMFSMAYVTLVGNNTKFWSDRWLHGCTIAGVAPNMFTLIP